VHGIINVIPPLPDQLPPLAAAVEAGSDDWFRARVAAAAPGYGLVLHATGDGGWRDSSGFDEQKLNAAAVRALAAGGLTLRLAATHLDQQTAGFITGLDAYRDEALARSNPDPEAYRHAHSLRAAAQYRGDGGFEWRAMLRSSRMDFLQHFLLGQPVEDNGQDSATLLLSQTRAGVGGGELTVGADTELAHSFLSQHQDGPTTGGSPAANAIRPAGQHYDYDVDSLLLAAYATWRRPLAPGWSLETGARLEWVRYDYDNRMLDGNTDDAGVPCPGGCLYSRPADRSDEFTNLAPRLGLVWRPAAGLAAYFSYARGFRAPETTELYRLQRQQSVADLDPERVDSFELGLRWRGAAGGIDLAAWTMDKDDVILRDSAGFTVSGGSTRHRGLEYALDWRPAPHWTISATGTVARHEYRFTAAVEQGEQITAGNDIDTAPRWLNALRLGRESGAFSGELEWLHVDEYWANAANTARYPGHDLVNLRMAWRPAPQWSLALRVANLLDADYADRADFAFGNYRYFPGRGRSAFLELGWRRE
jgi:outer membrane receptor protein involved in Fe transport